MRCADREHWGFKEVDIPEFILWNLALQRNKLWLEWLTQKRGSTSTSIARGGLNSSVCHLPNKSTKLLSSSSFSFADLVCFDGSCLGSSVSSLSLNSDWLACSSISKFVTDSGVVCRLFFMIFLTLLMGTSPSFTLLAFWSHLSLVWSCKSWNKFWNGSHPQDALFWCKIAEIWVPPWIRLIWDLEDTKLHIWERISLDNIYTCVNKGTLYQDREIQWMILEGWQCGGHLFC